MPCAGVWRSRDFPSPPAHLLMPGEGRTPAQQARLPFASDFVRVAADAWRSFVGRAGDRKRQVNVEGMAFADLEAFTDSIVANAVPRMPHPGASSANSTPITLLLWSTAIRTSPPTSSLPSASASKCRPNGSRPAAGAARRIAAGDAGRRLGGAADRSERPPREGLPAGRVDPGAEAGRAAQALRGGPSRFAPCVNPSPRVS